MSRQITLLDLIRKFSEAYPRNQSAVTRDDLTILYMATPGHPLIASEGTLNEKIRTLCTVRVLESRNSKVFKINWEQIEKLEITLTQMVD